MSRLWFDAAIWFFPISLTWILPYHVPSTARYDGDAAGQADEGLLVERVREVRRCRSVVAVLRPPVGMLLSDAVARVCDSVESCGIAWKPLL